MAIKINFDSALIPEQPTLVLATRSGKKIGGIPAENIKIIDCLNAPSEIQFEVHKYLGGQRCQIWDSIVNFKLVWCKEWDVWFEMTVDINESSEMDLVKTCSCTRLGQAELSQIMLFNIEINTEDDILRDDYKVTVLYNPDDPEASLLNRMMEKAPHYSILHVDKTIMNIQRTFTFDNKSIYDSFEEVADEIGCLFVFHSNSDDDGNIQRTFSVYDLDSNCNDCGYRGDFTGVCPECGSTNINEGYGKDTTIFVASQELADSIKFTTDTDAVKNCFKLVGGDDLMTATIRNCNPNGSDYIWYIPDWELEDMSDELVAKIKEYNELYDYYQYSHEYSEIDQDILGRYNALVEKYREYNKDLEEIELPIVGYPALMTAYYNTIDFDLYLQSVLMPTYETSGTTAAEEAAKLTAENISPVAVTSTSYISLATASSNVLNVAKILVRSGYQVKVNESSLSDLVWTGNFTVTNYSDSDDTAVSDIISVTITDDYEEYVKQLLEKAVVQNSPEDTSISGLFSLDYDDFCEQLKKYCLDGLTSIQDACQACINVLIEQGVADKESWASEENNLYDNLYVPYYEKLCAIQAEMAEREEEIGVILGTYDENGGVLDKGAQNYIAEMQAAVQAALNFESFMGEELWLEFCAYRREDQYSNDNYISDGLNNSEMFANALEFLSIASNEIYKSAELQHSISTTLKDLLVIDKFRPFTDYFEVGNWIRIKCDDEIYKLRLIGYEIDYNDLDYITVDFSDVFKTTSGISDQQSVISRAASMATSYGAISHQASQGAKGNATVENWVEDGLDATNVKLISNANSQSQTWDGQGMLFRKYNDVTDSYDDEQLRIINSTIAITDDNWETVKTAIGSFYYYDPITGDLVHAYGVNAETLIGRLILGEGLIINNSSGTFTFNEDGMVVTNGINTLTIDANSDVLFVISNDKGSVLSVDSDGNILVSGTLSSADGVFTGELRAAGGTFVGNLNAAGGTFTGSLVGVDGTFSGELVAASGTFSGELVAASGTFTGELQAASGTFTGELQAASGTFTGELSAATGSFSGQITAESGSIGGWEIGEDSLYKEVADSSSSTVSVNIIIPSEYGSPSEIMSIIHDDSAIGQYETFGLWTDGLLENTDISCETLWCSGTKSRVIKTDDFGDVLQYAYETASPMFGDIGSGETDDSGLCYIYLDPVFKETVSSYTTYQVFIQKEGAGDLWVQEKAEEYFLVQGTPNLSFSWEVKIKQRDYECERLEVLQIAQGVVESLDNYDDEDERGII